VILYLQGYLSSMFINTLLLLFLFFALAATITVVMHLFLEVPYVPTPVGVIEAMMGMAELKGNEVIYDLGAGDGRILIHAKKRYPGVTARGCEIVPTIWLMGVIRGWLSRVRISLKLQSALDMDLKNADVVFLYVTAPLMRKLAPKLERELRPGARVISHVFSIPGKEVHEERVVERWWGRAKVLKYVW
jgi:hypothetical protein